MIYQFILKKNSRFFSEPLYAIFFICSQSYQIMLKNILFVLVSCILFVSSSASDASKEYSFKQFKAQLQKNYSPQEESQRAKNFEKHQQYIRQRQKQGVNVPPNQLMDWTDEELAKITNFKPKVPQKSSEKPSFKVNTGFAAAPSSYDYRVYKKVSAVKYQGECGSCWAFSATAQYESLLLMLSSIQYDLSEQFLLQCTNGSSCNGGWPEDAINIAKTNGMPLEANYAYKGQQNYYSNICSADPKNFVKISGSIITNQYKYKVYTDIQQLKQLLIENGPMTVGVKANHSGFYYPASGGFIDNCPNKYDFVDHVVQLVGYTSSHWIIKNSWGSGWGDNGFGYIPFSNDCGILNNVWKVQLDVEWNNPNPSPEPSPEIVLDIEMTDTYGDGWNGNVLAIKHNNELVVQFGENFKSGYNSSQQVVVLTGTGQFSVVAKTLGYYRREVGFKIKKNGTLLTKLDPGLNFNQTSVFGTFCIQCQNKQVTFLLTLADSFGDGWNNNTIIITQGNANVQVGSNFKSGTQYGPISLSLYGDKEITVTPGVIGNWRQEIGYTFRNVYGQIIAQRNSGSSYYLNQILSQFVPNKINAFPVNVATDEDLNRKQDNSLEENNTQDTSTNQQILAGQTTGQIEYLVITIICLSVVSLFLMVSLIFVLVKILNKIQKARKSETLATSQNLNIPNENNIVGM